MPRVELRCEGQFQQHIVGLLLAEGQGERCGVVHVFHVQLLLQVALRREAADDQAAAEGDGE